ncbi:MAG TPA: DUF1501 domain-containing protein [Chthonomonadaceae bacterium]|nr:DUF1501 domain-containing protein [Chthonomonadaceae bacterium]
MASVGIAPTLGPLFLRSAAFAAEPARRSAQTGGAKVLICIFQRGAVDGISMVVPHGDPAYYQHRAEGLNGIAIPLAGDGAVLDLDGRFGLHPALAPLKPLYDAGNLAPIHACGSPNASRSHFDAQDYMESAAPGDKSVKDGWLARAMAHCPEDRAKLKSLFRSVAMTPYVPRSLQGASETLAIADLNSFGVARQGAPVRRMMPNGEMDDAMAPPAAPSGFEAMYAQENGDLLHGTGKEAFAAVKVVKKLTAAGYTPAAGATYPRTPFGRSLEQIAQLVKAKVGLEVGFAEIGGWDTHARQGGVQGTLANKLRELGQGLAALAMDLGDKMSDVVILTMSEFGRTVRQNGTGGTDHGHATCFLALGGSVNGGKVLGQWPGLAPDQLYENRDLAVTTDFRDVFGEISRRHLGIQDLKAVFPGYTSDAAKFRGVLRG